MKQLLLIILTSTCTFVSAYSQNDNIPFATKVFLKNDLEWNHKFSSPDNNYSKNQAIIDNEKIINKLYKPVDGIKKLGVYNKRLKILTEGFAEVITTLIPRASPFVAAGKEYLYQKADESVDKKLRVEVNKFNKKLKSAFTSSVSRKLKDNPDLTYQEAVDNFSNELQSFSSNLNPEHYRFLAPIADKQSLEFIKQNRAFFEQKFKEQKDNIDKIIQQSKDDLSKEFDSKMNSFKFSIDELDKKLLNEIQKNANSLATFNKRVEIKFQKMDADVKEMHSDIKKNEKQIALNKKSIKENKHNIALVKKLQSQNANLISENSFKIGVITDVLYDNVDIKGRIRILDLKFKNDKKNAEYLKTKNTLKNIQTIQDVQSYLRDGGDFLELANNLDLSDEDAHKANKAIALGNVLINGTMAFYGNPMSGIQAINGAFALFGGDNSEPDPEFKAIMAEFDKVNRKLDIMNKKLDTINANISDLRKLNVDLFIENQKRFTKIDEKLITIEFKLDHITQLMYADISSLKLENIPQWNHLWEGIRNAKTLDELRSLYEQNQKVKDMIQIVFDNTENNSLITKKFLHFNSFNQTWENDIYKPLLYLINQVYPNINPNSLELSVIRIPDYVEIPKIKIDYKADNIFKHNLTGQIDKLIYPQSILTLTEFTILSEPYFYFYNNPDDNNFTIPKDININTSNKNKNLRNKFENILIENRKSIAQTNIISGAILLPYLKKQILDKSFDMAHKKYVYELLLSKNEYLKLNFSNYIINTELTLSNQIEKFYEILNKTDYNKSLEIVNEINIDFNFENSYFKLNLIGNETYFKPVITLLPQNIRGLDLTNKTINLPIPPFEYISEQKVLYPEFLQGLLQNQNILVNKIAKYDIIEKFKDMPEYQNFFKLN